VKILEQVFKAVLMCTCSPPLHSTTSKVPLNCSQSINVYVHGIGQMCLRFQRPLFQRQRIISPMMFFCRLHWRITPLLLLHEIVTVQHRWTCVIYVTVCCSVHCAEIPERHLVNLFLKSVSVVIMACVLMMLFAVSALLEVFEFWSVVKSL